MELSEIRERIDVLDRELIALIEERMKLSEEVARVKKEKNLPILNAARERDIIAHLTEGKTEEMAEYIKILYTTIFDVSRSHQANIIYDQSDLCDKVKAALENTPKVFPKSAKVACQGIEGANSTTACEKLFDRPEISYYKSFDEIFGAVESGECRYGVLPIENSLHGSVNAVYDLMSRHQCYIVNSVKVKINHCLLGVKGCTLSDIKTVYSHEQALGQCSDILKDMNVKIVPCANTAIAAQMTKEANDKSVACISSARCAEIYGLDLLKENIHNNENNYTKFICISKKMEIYPGAKKISLMMTLPHRPGSLYGLMAKFAALGINLSKLQSRPIPEKDFEFLFYFDLDVSVYDEAAMRILSQLSHDSEKFVLMGCYEEC